MPVSGKKIAMHLKKKCALLKAVQFILVETSVLSPYKASKAGRKMLI